MADIVLQPEDSREMQVGIDIGNQSDGYREVLVLAARGMVIVSQLEDSRRMQVGSATGNKSDHNYFTVGEYEEDA